MKTFKGIIVASLISLAFVSISIAEETNATTAPTAQNINNNSNNATQSDTKEAPKAQRKRRVNKESCSIQRR